MSKNLRGGEGDLAINQREGGEIIDEQLLELLDDMQTKFTGGFDRELKPGHFKHTVHFSSQLMINDSGRECIFKLHDKIFLFVNIFQEKNFERIINTILLFFGLNKENIIDNDFREIKKYILIEIFEKLITVDKNTYIKFIEYIKDNDKLPFVEFCFFYERGLGGFILGKTGKNTFYVLEVSPEKAISIYELDENQKYDLSGMDVNEEIIPVGEIYHKFWEDKEASKGGEKGNQTSHVTEASQEGLAETLESKLDIEGLIDQVWASPREKWAKIIFPQTPKISEEIEKDPKGFSERLLKKFEFDTCLFLKEEVLKLRIRSFIMILEILQKFDQVSNTDKFYDLINTIIETKRIAIIEDDYLNLIIGKTDKGLLGINFDFGYDFIDLMHFDEENNPLYFEAFRNFWKERGIDTEQAEAQAKEKGLL